MRNETRVCKDVRGDCISISLNRSCHNTYKLLFLTVYPLTNFQFIL